MAVDLMTMDETAAKLRVSRSTLYKWTSKKKIPFIKLGTKVLFDPVQIEGWVENHGIKPVDQQLQ